MKMAKLLYHLLACSTLLAPLLVTIWYEVRIEAVEEAINAAMLLEKKELAHKIWRDRLAVLEKASHNRAEEYLNQIAKIPLLARELGQLEKKRAEELLPERELIRWQQVLSNQKKWDLLLVEKKKIAGLEEAHWAQQTLLEVDDEDLKQIIARIEGHDIWPYAPLENYPPSYVSHFFLEKTDSPQPHFLIKFDIMTLNESLP